MNILYYCQHVLGVGHFFRTLEICRALQDHRVTLVSGGPRIAADLPEHVEMLQLPELRMDENFGALLTADPALPLPAVQARRRTLLSRAFSGVQPAVLVVELYPFGRKAFRFELDPLLQDIAQNTGTRCRVLCSLRDILVEKKDPAAYEAQVVKHLNRYFDALLIHADPDVVRLSETFSRLGDVRIPVVYTGFVSPRPPPGARSRLRRELGLREDDRLIVASAGGGGVGYSLLRAVLAAFACLDSSRHWFLQIFSGPFMPAAEFDALRAAACENIRVERFTAHFLSYLAAADLSVSMAGYNTCMNILAADVPALVYPFAQNREQRLRAQRLMPFSRMELIGDAELAPRRLAHRMAAAGGRMDGTRRTVDLDGARKTAAWIDSQGSGG